MNGYDPAADLGGMALSSGPELAASFFVRKIVFTADIELPWREKTLPSGWSTP
jgi:hypothetical protein